jgi:PhnB protein
VTFDGRCEAAFNFYARVLGGRIAMLQRHSDMPAAANVGADWRDKVLHAELAVGDEVLMGADSPPSMFTPPQGFSVQLGIDDPDEGERIFSALAENGAVRMPFAETFWAKRFGMLTDRFGVPWMLNCARTS